MDGSKSAEIPNGTSPSETPKPSVEINPPTPPVEEYQKRAAEFWNKFSADGLKDSGWQLNNFWTDVDDADWGTLYRGAETEGVSDRTMQKFIGTFNLGAAWGARQTELQAKQGGLKGAVAGVIKGSKYAWDKFVGNSPQHVWDDRFDPEKTFEGYVSSTPPKEVKEGYKSRFTEWMAANSNENKTVVDLSQMVDKFMEAVIPADFFAGKSWEKKSLDINPEVEEILAAVTAGAIMGAEAVREEASHGGVDAAAAGIRERARQMWAKVTGRERKVNTPVWDDQNNVRKLLADIFANPKTPKTPTK